MSLLRLLLSSSQYNDTQLSCALEKNVMPNKELGDQLYMHNRILRQFEVTLSQQNKYEACSFL